MRTARILRPIVDDLPPEVTAIDLSQSGKLLQTVSNPRWGGGECTYYPSTYEYQLPAPLPTLLRSDLAVSRRIRFVDKVVYGEEQEKVAAYKFNACPGSLGGGIWPEIQLLARLAPHPRIIAIDSLVLDEISGQGVIGFTMPFMPAPTLEDRLPRPFKLRWLRELMDLVDELYFEYGIVHQDIRGDNLSISDTGSILIFDFGLATQVGTDRNGRFQIGEIPEMNDVKGTMFFLYRLITHDPQYSQYFLRGVDESNIVDRDKWVKHADVELDHDVDTFYNELMAWVRKRRDGPKLTHYTQAPRHFEIPDMPEHNMGWWCGNSHSKTEEEAGRPVLTWERPPASKWDKSRKLLATGKYADEQPPVRFMHVPDPKKGFPQIGMTNAALPGQDGQKKDG
ncbi:hypothetical protein B0T24DRAFT_564866 [Lasiosphaeria ovina]|uniref:Protein kinase domain-containing protein n=1 Tax=Lasiosphaeria ovina TaxID=92902 RepID=A0AAE0NJC6_9PEZI|nr:hypothetical protein B0T24DRAFT_564866 [Lasiosphaeria ovina]